MFARAAFCDVTPDRPVRLAGYVARQAPTSTVLDPIEIAALLLETAERRCLILSFDLMMVGAELEARILSQLAPLGFGDGEVMLLASHTHTAPATDRACAHMGPPDGDFVEAAADAAITLVRRMLQQSPSVVRIDILSGALDHAINRRRPYPFPTFSRTHGLQFRSVTFSPNPAGPRNEDATILVLRKIDDGAPLAVLWHYTCHPTAAMPKDAISADYPGAVRSGLRAQFGAIPCLFAQGFCGDIRPNIMSSAPPPGLRQRLARAVRVAVSGPQFPAASSADWTRWRDGMAAAMAGIVRRGAVRTIEPERLDLGSASIAMDAFFAGRRPDKRLTAKILRIGSELEIVALSAEVTVGWQDILNRAAPAADALRLHVGYLGSVFGYLPTAAQVSEGGYEVQGFQPLFGLAGHFDAGRIEPAVTACVRAAFDDLEKARDVAPAAAQ